MEKKIRNLLIAFFALMLIFTVISRIAASAMVAKVAVQTVSSGNLLYEVSGTGMIKANARKYIELLSGYKIQEVYMEAGKQVEKGDVLFSYDMDSIKGKKSELEDEFKKLELQYKNIGLTSNSMNSEADEKDLQLAINTAKEDISIAEKNLEDKKEFVIEDKEKEYKEALAEWEETTLSREESLKKAEREVIDAKAALDKLKEPETTLTELISNYKTAVEYNNEEQLKKAYDSFLKYYYEDNLEEHNNQINDAEKSIARALEDYEGIDKKWRNITINDWYQYGDEDMKNTYYEKVQVKLDEISRAKRALQDAQDELNELAEFDNKLNKTLEEYKNDIHNIVDATTPYQALCDMLLKGKKASTEEEEAAETKLLRAKEDLEEEKIPWDRKCQLTEEKKDELYKTLQDIHNGSYDFSKDLKEESIAIEAAKRAYDKAELQLEQWKKNKQSVAEAQDNQTESFNIEKSILEIDRKSCQEKIDNINVLIKDKGKIHTPVAGVISDNDLVQGITLSGQEKLMITTGGYELAMTADKEDMKFFAVGDEIKIRTLSDKADITSQIENIELPDQNGLVSFTTLLPEDDYQLGASLEFDITKSSKNYPRCVPIQALRQDPNGAFILLAKEKDSVLGKENEAFRLSVTILSKDGSKAAIDGALTEEDEIIVESNRSFSEGDRVRIYDVE